MLVSRPRRLRSHPTLRDLVAETDLRLSQLVQPYFLSANPKAQEAITGFTDVFRWGLETLSAQVENDLERGVKSFLLFGAAPEDQKNAQGSGAWDVEGLLPTAIQTLKKRFGSAAFLFSDVCLCPYTDHGHCGHVLEDRVTNDSSLEALSKMALVHAQAGVDFVAPSDMMDGRVAAIRAALDKAQLTETGILAYSAKYASSYYGPFREALGSSPGKSASAALSDRSTYQMDYRNRSEALKELALDIEEGADMVMVKPALAYLDIIAGFRDRSSVPIAAYSVSAEYEMVKGLAARGMADEKKMVLENLTAIRRAGAQVIVTYHATQIAKQGWL